MRVLAVAGDPGGARALEPVLERLRREGDDVDAVAYAGAVSIWKDDGLRPEEWTGGDEGARLARNRPDLVLLGTSANQRQYELRFAEAARRRGISALAVVDHWSYYRERFTDVHGRAVWPDAIAVIDDRSRTELAAAGAGRESIHVTGQPAFDDLAEAVSRITAERRKAVRRLAGVSDEDRLVLFVSQPLSRTVARSPGAAHPGYDEEETLTIVLEALEQVAARRPSTVCVGVRPHPREERPPEAVSTPHVRVRILGEASTREWIQSSELVVGMNSLALVESCLLGVPTLSVQPGLRRNEILPWREEGALPVVTDPAKVGATLERFLFDESAIAELRGRLAALPKPGGATGRLVNLARSLAARTQTAQGPR